MCLQFHAQRKRYETKVYKEKIKQKKKKCYYFLQLAHIHVTQNFKLYDECNRCALQLLNKYTLLIHLYFMYTYIMFEKMYARSRIW